MVYLLMEQLGSLMSLALINPSKSVQLGTMQFLFLSPIVYLVVSFNPLSLFFHVGYMLVKLQLCCSQQNSKLVSGRSVLLYCAMNLDFILPNFLVMFPVFGILFVDLPKEKHEEELSSSSCQSFFLFVFDLVRAP